MFEILGAKVNRTTEEAQETACKYMKESTLSIFKIFIF